LCSSKRASYRRNSKQTLENREKSPSMRLACRVIGCPDGTGSMKYTALFFVRTGPLLCITYESREPGPASSLRAKADYGASPCTGSRQWNLPIESSHALTAAPSLFLRPVSRSFSTTNSLRTTPSTASSVRRSVSGERRECALRRGPPARSAARRPLFPSSRRRDARCYAGRAFRSRGRYSLRRNLLQRRTEKQISPELRGEACGTDQRGKLRPMTLAVNSAWIRS